MNTTYLIRLINLKSKRMQPLAILGQAKQSEVKEFKRLYKEEVQCNTHKQN